MSVSHLQIEIGIAFEVGYFRFHLDTRIEIELAELLWPIFEAYF